MNRIRQWWFFREYEISKLSQRFWWWIAFRAPKRLVYFAAMRVGGYATSGKYGNTIVPELTFMDAVTRWSHDHGI